LSIVKDTFAIGPSGPGQGYSGYQKFYTIQYRSTFTNQTFEEDLIGYLIRKGHGNGGFVLLTSKSIGDKNLNAEIIDILDSLTIESKTYKEVIKMKILADQYISQNYYLYYTDSIGLIKKELVVNNVVSETWNLSAFNTILLEPQ